MNDFNGPGPSRGRGRRGASGNRRPRRNRPNEGRHVDGPSGHHPRALSQPPSRGRPHQRDRYERDSGRHCDRDLSPPRKTIKAGPGIYGVRPFEYTAVPHDMGQLLQQIVTHNQNNDNAQQYPGNNTNPNHNQNNSKKNNHRERTMGFKVLEDISHSDGTDIIERINKQKKLFMQLLDTPVDKKKQDVFALLMELITNVSKSSFEESKKLFLLEICDSKFIDHLQLYLMQLPYSDKDVKYFNKYYWNKEKEFWWNFMTFCECIINVSPSTAVRKCGSLIEATTKMCLDGLKERHGFDLPEEYAARMTKIRDSLKTCDVEEPKQEKRKETNEMGEPLESFRKLSILPTPEELLNKRPYLRPNVVEGAYVDKEHYLDVQFRLLREDCFGPLRDGIHQFIEEPRRNKYDNIRVYYNVKILEPFVSKQKMGSTVLLDESTMKRFKKVNWAHSKRFLFGCLVLFTKDNCKTFLIGTILERDEKYLNKRQIRPLAPGIKARSFLKPKRSLDPSTPQLRKLPVNIVSMPAESNIYNDDSYTMIECEVYFEPYYHVLKALQDPNFPEHIAMSNYIVDVKKVPEIPAYVTPDTMYTVKTKDDAKVQFKVLQEETWPSQSVLGFNSTQYEAYKLALTHEFAVIQGPPGTGKTFIGVKIAETLLKNFSFRHNKSCLLVICFTNHALDQFLEALLPVTRSIVRIGGRSRNKELEPYNINNLRRKDDSSYFHERRINLKLEIGGLELAKARVEALYTGVLSYNSIVAYVEECKIIARFYKGSGIKDPLKHWLFENIDNIEFEPLLEQQVEKEEHGLDIEDIDVDNDIFERHELLFDDLDDDDFQGDRRGFNFVTTSFSLPDAEDEMKKLLKEFQNSQEKGVSLHKQRELQNEICHLYSQIKLLRDMQPYRARTPRINLTTAQDITSIPRIERWSLYFKWANVAMEVVKKEIKNLEKKMQSSAEAYEEARMMVDLAVLKRTHVIGMTTTGAARLRKLLAEVAPPIVVVEEAAEVLEAHIVTSLTKSCQHLILIGDHQQLRPSAAYVRLARHYNIEVSLFERMIMNAVHSRRLGVQHRMRPEIAALICPHIYTDLKNHPSVEEFPPVRGVVNNLFFFTHENREQCEDDSSSRTNRLEGDLTLRLANYLMQQGYQPEDVTILTAYSGQMFYLRKQRSLYHHLSNVKITVLDNYQGEESKIILLSLVRNNTNDSIGFLGTENRICVALSRAREGFYIFGNIELLKSKSTLWSNIAKTLTDNQSLGTSLRLKCTNHSDQITTIETLTDFVKVPEGGCLKECKYLLPCGHPCPRVCHAYDLVHANIQCIKDCDRKICEIEGHKCPLPCATKCRPCQRLVEKSLLCGHNKVVPCYREAGDPSIHCAFVLSVTLPDCGHEAQKACSTQIEDVKCKAKCPNSRLNCGHACRRACHVNDDPEHKRYACMKPCPKAKYGCTANLEGDLGEHQCLRSCCDECVPCNVQVIKKRSGCRHSKRVACHENVDLEPCREKCARSLPCNHFCKKFCFEKCGDCKQKVKKKVPDCNHEIEMPCGTGPTRDLCRRKCNRILSCGHACPSGCNQPCDQNKCTKIMDRLFDSPCGHKVQLPCNLYGSMISGGMDGVSLLAHCAAPCGAVLRCGHACGGSCAACRQGRLHAPCAAVCHQLNICGHRCEEPCNQVCPPCPKRCEVKCQHSACGKLCGAPCVPCTERGCSRNCEHSRCSRPCGAPCDRVPCDLPCPKTQPCGHPCRGLCGEPCPKACNVCDPINFPTDLLGDPYEDDDKLVKLQDCPHILDVANLDNLMNSKTETVQIKTCPFCRKPIINTYRYKDLVNKLLKNDINPIKEKVYGTDDERRNKKEEMLLKIKTIIDIYQLPALENIAWRKACEKIYTVIRLSRKEKRVSLLQLDMHDVYLNILDNVGKYYVKYRAANLTQLKTEFNSQVKLVCEVLAANVHKISQQQQVDIENELRRINSIIQLAKILGHSSYITSKTASNVVETATAANEAVLSWRVYDEGKAVDSLTKLQNAVKLSGIASKEEREMVVKAIGLRAGHWYKCPNGHFYCIGECGGAMELARCPDCGATIGGQSHALTAGNRHAGEVDGSRFAAWSEQANNMANFRFN